MFKVTLNVQIGLQNLCICDYCKMKENENEIQSFIRSSFMKLIKTRLIFPAKKDHVQLRVKKIYLRLFGAPFCSFAPSFFSFGKVHIGTAVTGN